jgi:hypothetical protein
VVWHFDGTPDSATICNCTVCRRYGVLWAYGHVGENIVVTAAPTAYSAYAWGDRSLSFNFCSTCGCITHWQGLSPGGDGRTRIAVNLRLAEPGEVGKIVLDRFDGLDSFDDLPRDGRCLADVLF